MWQVQLFPCLLLLTLCRRTSLFLLDTDNSIYFYVSPTGADNNSGTDASHPFKTITAALHHSNSARNIHKDVVIELLEGYHEQHTSLHVINKGSRKVTIRAYQDREVHVTGGKRIQSSAFRPVTDHTILNRLPPNSRKHVYSVKLNDVGITDFGSIQEFGFYHRVTAPLEIFENGTPYRMARYPNKGYINVQTVHSTTSFTYKSDRPRQWHSEQDVWVYGFWHWSWADMAIKVAHLDSHNSTITLTKPTRYGLTMGHYNNSDPASAGFSKQGGYFRFFNVLSELDEPGEYYVDHTTGTLYLWPLNNTITQNDVIYASLANDCILVSRDSRNIVMEGFIVEACRRYGINANHVNSITITSMLLQNTGAFGIYASGNSIKINRNYFRNTEGGIALNGGSIPTLSPSGNEVSDNYFSDFGRTAIVGPDAVYVEGVGNHIHHNTLLRGTYNGIRWGGNDNIFEYNHISDMCQGASDCGAVHAGRSFSSRGNIIRYNHIQNTKRLVPGADVRGIMLDDEYSGALIEHNVFHDNDVHVNIGGGRDNIVRQNIFYNTSQYSMQLDARGEQGGHTTEIMAKLSKIPYTNDLWSRRYPELAAVAHISNPGLPEGNVIAENIFFSTSLPNFQTYGRKFSPSWFNITHNMFISEGGNFLAPEFGNFKPRCLLNDFVNQTKFKDPVLALQVGPRFHVGPLKMNFPTSDLGYKTGRIPSPTPCNTKPALSPPKTSYLPDGSTTNTLYHITAKTGCWFSIDKCPNDHSLEKTHRPTSPLYRDTQSETQDHSGDNEFVCLSKANVMAQRCGTGSSFAIIFAPTGATTLGGDGCYMAYYGCPLHGINTPRMSRDVYAEQHLNGAHDESKCLSRALSQWRWCGADPNYPVTSIFRPTGNTRTAGSGCWIHPEKCPADPSMNHLFYDGFGAANYKTDENQDTCFARGEHFWRHCGGHPEYKVHIYYRPNAASTTFPN